MNSQISITLADACACVETLLFCINNDIFKDSARASEIYDRIFSEIPASYKADANQTEFNF
jgi:hypothetical protein